MWALCRGAVMPHSPLSGQRQKHNRVVRQEAQENEAGRFDALQPMPVGIELRPDLCILLVGDVVL